MNTIRQLLAWLFRDRIAETLTSHDQAGQAMPGLYGPYGQQWPDECDPDEPCSLWNWRGDRPVETICVNHAGNGKHHPPPLRYAWQPHIATVTDLADRRRVTFTQGGGA
jgi:hypothetical protein